MGNWKREKEALEVAWSTVWERIRRVQDNGLVCGEEEKLLGKNRNGGEKTKRKQIRPTASPLGSSPRVFHGGSCEMDIFPLWTGELGESLTVWA